MSRPRLINREDASAPLTLDRELLVRIHDLMVKTRVLEERLIQMYKQGHGYFWIGGPGEEAFNVPLGLLMGRVRFWKYFFQQPLLVLGNVPGLAFAVFALILFGIGAIGPIVVTTLAAPFTITALVFTLRTLGLM